MAAPFKLYREAVRVWDDLGWGAIAPLRRAGLYYFTWNIPLKKKPPSPARGKKAFLRGGI
ncbi:MAG: hypothetical protein VR69_07805 [Peptococcaceae bacterium BRH_c4b]|nr:MAG: hypothetical protein VR69_07805 [Peptococcaceae bacterium BRH_c4b]